MQFYEYPALIGQALLRRIESGKDVEESKTVSVTVSEDTKFKLEDLASRSGLSLNQLVALALESELLDSCPMQL